MVTAVQRALALPEIVGEVLSWIDIGRYHISIKMEEDTYWYGRLGVLFRCALVNHLWFREAVAFLWRDLRCPVPFRKQALFPTCLEDHDFDCAQFYANLVQQATLSTFHEGWADFYKEIVDGIVFPNLERLVLCCQGFADESYYFAQIKCPNLKVLELDPHFEINPTTYLVHQDDWNEIFDCIAVRFMLL